MIFIFNMEQTSRQDVDTELAAGSRIAVTMTFLSNDPNKRELTRGSSGTGDMCVCVCVCVCVCTRGS